MKKIAVITGGTSGLGKELKRLYENDGYTVCNLSRSCDDEERDEYRCDVTDEAQVNAAVEKIAKKYGRIDALINNAGAGLLGATELVDTAAVRRVFDVSYYGALHVTRACLPHMMRGGRIAFICSIAAFIPVPFRSVYSSAKAAELMLGEALRLELKGAGICVTCICPGEIRTSFSANRICDAGRTARYGDRPAAALRHVAEKESKRMPISKVINKLYAICTRGKKPIYIIGGKYKFFNAARKLLPTDLFLKCTGGAVKGKGEKE